MISPAEVEAVCDVIEDLLIKLARLESRVGSTRAESIRYWVYTLAWVKSKLDRAAQELEAGNSLTASEEACEAYSFIQKRIITMRENDAVGQSLRGELVSVADLAARLCGRGPR
ncbi:MAG: hypothetical protein F7B20_06385 [Aeropyrum sp.]|nr:hypothetical protein [Aeropyrum sp.]MCE4616730.1 hypothetical protein [Aeropyrum sp.]